MAHTAYGSELLVKHTLPFPLDALCDNAHEDRPPIDRLTSWLRMTDGLLRFLSYVAVADALVDAVASFASLAG